MVVEIWESDKPPLEDGHRGEIWEYWAGWCTKGVLEPYGVSLWKFIRQGCPIFSQFIQFDVGAGNRVKIWHDLRCGVCTLKEAYLELYSISRNKESSIAEVKQFPNQMLHCDIQFSRAIQEGS